MTKKVIVIGAGMAGIMAAKTLQEAGVDVTVLEARDRVGGRTHTDRSMGASVDLGASWIHGYYGNPLTPLARELKIEMGYTDFLNRSITAVQAYNEDGSMLDQADYADGLQRGLGALYHRSGSELYERPEQARTLQDWIDHGLPKPEGMNLAQEQGFKYHTLISSEYVSAADWDELAWGYNETYVSLPGGDELLHGGGFNKLTDYLSNGLDIRVAAAVHAVKSTADGVQVDSSAGLFDCDQVVVTVPLGVLKGGSITFSPPLSAEKQQAIDRIGFGAYEKLAIRFDKFYWPKDAQRFNYMSTGEPSLFHAWLNIGYYTGEPIIVAYHAGRRARHINQLSDGDLLEQTLTVMQRIFGDNGFGEIPAPERFVRTGWESDPFSQGSYSFNHVDQHKSDRRTLARPIGNQIFFAGEASHPAYYATVHGAYETGIRAAREILSLDD